MRDGGARAGLIEHHLPFARMMAAKLFTNRYGDDIEFDDYLQFATVGLIEAVDRYLPGSVAVFTTYASKRIRGAVLDGVERMSDRQQQISTRQRLQKERGEALATEGAGGARIEDVFEQLAGVAIGLALEYILDDTTLYQDEELSQAENRYNSLELRQLRQRLLEMVESLPEQERLLIKYNYFNHIPFESVAQLWGVTRGRVAQVHRSALERLRGLSRNARLHDMAW
jgi:RNA polymerase sigma factor for flagellar operon FliA